MYRIIDNQILGAISRTIIATHMRVLPGRVDLVKSNYQSPKFYLMHDVRRVARMVRAKEVGGCGEESSVQLMRNRKCANEPLRVEDIYKCDEKESK